MWLASLAYLVYMACFTRKGDIKGLTLALSEAMEATEVYNNLKNERRTLDTCQNRYANLVLFIKFYMMASETKWQPQRP